MSEDILPPVKMGEPWFYEDGSPVRVEGSNTVYITASPDDATTCPGCRVAVPLGQFCKCPMRWKG